METINVRKSSINKSFQIYSVPNRMHACIYIRWNFSQRFLGFDFKDAVSFLVAGFKKKKYNVSSCVGLLPHYFRPRLSSMAVVVATNQSDDFVASTANLFIYLFVAANTIMAFNNRSRRCWHLPRIPLVGPSRPVPSKSSSEKSSPIFELDDIK